MYKIPRQPTYAELVAYTAGWDDAHEKYCKNGKDCQDHASVRKEMNVGQVTENLMSDPHYREVQ